MLSNNTYELNPSNGAQPKKADQQFDSKKKNNFNKNDKSAPAAQVPKNAKQNTKATVSTAASNKNRKNSQPATLGGRVKSILKRIFG